jgi:ATP-dependent Lon protease
MTFERVAILPLRNSVLFPMSVVPINVGRPRSIRLVEELDQEGSLVGVIAQRDPAILEPTFDDLFTVGTLARVVKVIRISAGSYSVVLNGVSRFHVHEAVGLEPFMRAEVRRIADEGGAEPLASLVQKATELREKTRQALSFMSDLPKETAAILDNVESPGALADLIASNLPEELASVPVRQSVLEAIDPAKRVDIVSRMLDRQLESLRIKSEISNLVETEMTKSHRAYVLRKQLRAIRDELGESADDDDEVDELRERLALMDLPDEARQAAKKQLSRLASMQSQSGEYQVARTYVEWILDLPWRTSTTDRFDVAEVRRCLDQDHHGLEQVKKRIVEYSAIRQLRPDNRSPILLFVGPPGVGKTSLGRSIARAMGRRYGRIALGGVRDEAEIRGHRRTYVGALPGRIIQALKKVGSNNPVLVLDEVDKMGTDMRGDPASALLEVLDPSQNDTFADHYLDLGFDLSKVIFLCTANYRGNIPEALADRLEIIDVPGYTQREKREIAKTFLVPKQIAASGLKEGQLKFEDLGLEALIERYTREAGVRGLERAIASVCREMAVRQVEGKEVHGVQVTPDLVQELLGPPLHEPETAEATLAAGVAMGLGSSPAGGELLVVEVSRMPGKGGVRVTGSLGPVLGEAAQTAVSFVRSRSRQLSLPDDWIKNLDLHLHIPRARAVQDFAGVGVAIFGAVCSLLLDAPCRSDVAVVGELTLRGAVLPVRGIKSMLLSAERAGITEVLLPARNEPDVAEVPSEVLAALRIRYIHRVDEVLPLLLKSPLRSLAPEPAAPTSEAHP